MQIVDVVVMGSGPSLPYCPSTVCVYTRARVCVFTMRLRPYSSWEVGARPQDAPVCACARVCAYMLVSALVHLGALRMLRGDCMCVCAPACACACACVRACACARVWV